MPEPTKVIGNKQTDNCLSNNFLWLQCIILPKFLTECCTNTQKPVKNSPWHKSTGNGNYFSYHFVVKIKWSMNSQLDQTLLHKRTEKLSVLLLFVFLSGLTMKHLYKSMSIQNSWLMYASEMPNKFREDPTLYLYFGQLCPF